MSIKTYGFSKNEETGAGVQRSAGRAISAEPGTARPENLAAAGYTLYFAAPTDGVTFVLQGMWEAAVEQQDWKTAHALADAIATLKEKR